MAIVGMGIGIGDINLILGGLSRWSVEALCVLGGGGLTLAAKQAILHRRSHTKAI